jgi:hypothetical protein
MITESGDSKDPLILAMFFPLKPESGQEMTASFHFFFWGQVLDQGEDDIPDFLLQDVVQELQGIGDRILAPGLEVLVCLDHIFPGIEETEKLEDIPEGVGQPLFPLDGGLKFLVPDIGRLNQPAAVRLNFLEDLRHDALF